MSSVIRRLVSRQGNKINRLWRCNSLQNTYLGNRMVLGVRSFSDSIIDDNNDNICDNKGEMNIEFLLRLFQNLHSRNLTDVMTDTLSEFKLTKEQTLQLLYSKTFLTLNQHIVVSLLENDGIINDNVKSQELWLVLKEWCIHHINTTAAVTNTANANNSNTASNSSNDGNSITNFLSMSKSSNAVTTTPAPPATPANKEWQWLRVMKIFLPYIRFEEMDSNFFLSEIENIPDEYNILSRDRKYQIIRQHCYNLIAEKQIRDKMRLRIFGNSNGNVGNNSSKIVEMNTSSESYARLDRPHTLMYDKIK